MKSTTKLSNDDRKKRTSELLTRAISICAIIISSASLYLNYKNSNQDAESDAIKSIYSTFFELDRLALSNWQLSHLFATPESYNEVKRKVSLSVAVEDTTGIISLDLQERALALQIFDYYEQTIYLQDHAKRNNLAERQKFIQTVLDHLSNRLMTNPRLLYFWTVLINEYDKITKDYYKSHVFDFTGAQHPNADVKGPYLVRLNSLKMVHPVNIMSTAGTTR